MKILDKFFRLLFSSVFSMALLLIFLLAITSATFIENSFDSVTAKLLVYNNIWFESLLVLLGINLIGTLWKKKLFRKEKIAPLLFHLSFIILIIGAGVTRYFGFEGDMHIREGESTNLIYSNEPYFSVNDISTSNYLFSDSPLYFSQLWKNSFNMQFPINEEKKINFEFKEYYTNAKEYLTVDFDKNIAVIELSYTIGEKIETIYLQKGTNKNIGRLKFSYNTDSDHDVKIIEEKNGLNISSLFEINKFRMGGKFPELITKDSIGYFEENKVYSIDGVLFRFTKFHRNTKIGYLSGEDESIKKDVIIFNASLENQEKEIVIIYDRDRYMQPPVACIFDDLRMEISYGPKPIKIPFSIYLNKFILINYPGSNYPSSYESEITLIDEANWIKEKHIISKSKILDYQGFRFFQTLYDEDEKGTILSVNHDFYGTWVTYFGYFVLSLGFLVTFFYKGSRYKELNKRIKEVRKKGKSIFTIILIGLVFPLSSHAQSNNSKLVNKKHADKFGELLVQSYSGRFQPVNTLAYDFIRKVTKKNFVLMEGNKKIKPMQAFMDMLVNPEYWKNQKIIYVGDQSIVSKLGLSAKYTSFNNLFDNNRQYRLKLELQNSFNKKDKDQTKFDKELIKLTERVNVMLMIFNGRFLKLFPEPSSENHQWLAWNDSLAYQEITGKLALINADFQFEVLNYNRIMIAYLSSLKAAIINEDYSRPEQIIEYISNIQRSLTDKNLLPKKLTVKLEIIYNKVNLISILMLIYAILGFIFLVVVLFAGNSLQEKKTVFLNKIVVSIFIVGFLTHSFVLIARWIITKHVPWSNAYEVLLFVSWCCILAGFLFLKKNKIILAASSIMAFVLLMTASYANFDPQLTNLQPVLKSNWLVFHVATITAGYALFALALIIGVINILLYLTKNDGNRLKVDFKIHELTYINEQVISIGLFLATVGTFLGAIWANESWGRYWGWDPKETWSLAIIIVYAIILHFRFIPRLQNLLLFNASSIIAFGSVIMTFIGVNYYFKEGLHSYASDDPPLFPIWAWVTIVLVFGMVFTAVIKEKRYTDFTKLEHP